MSKIESLDFYELWGMKYRSFLYAHDSMEPTTKVLKNLAKILKEHGLEDTIIQSIETHGSPDDEDVFHTTIIVSE